MDCILKILKNLTVETTDLKFGVTSLFCWLFYIINLFSFKII